MKDNLICIKNLKKEGFSVVADENTRDMFYVEHVYPVGSQIPDEETLKEMDDAIYDIFCFTPFNIFFTIFVINIFDSFWNKYSHSL